MACEGTVVCVVGAEVTRADRLLLEREKESSSLAVLEWFEGTFTTAANLDRGLALPSFTAGVALGGRLCEDTCSRSDQKPRTELNSALGDVRRLGGGMLELTQSGEELV